jgi:hypothetical protein
MGPPKSGTPSSHGHQQEGGPALAEPRLSHSTELPPADRAASCTGRRSQRTSRRSQSKDTKCPTGEFKCGISMPLEGRPSLRIVIRIRRSNLSKGFRSLKPMRFLPISPPTSGPDTRLPWDLSGDAEMAPAKVPGTCNRSLGSCQNRCSERASRPDRFRQTIIRCQIVCFVGRPITHRTSRPLIPT